MTLAVRHFFRLVGVDAQVQQRRRPTDADSVAIRVIRIILDLAGRLDQSVQNVCIFQSSLVFALVRLIRC